MKKKIIVSSVIAVLLLIAGAVGGFYYEIKNNPQDAFQNSPAATPSNVVKAENKQSDEQTQLPTGKINVVLLGLDKNAARVATYGDAFRTDTIMVLAIDFDAKKVDIISIPRDSYVKIAGKDYMDKINSAFLHGGGFEGDGFNTVLSTISALLGDVPVNYYVAVDMDVVSSLVDAIGGVYYNVEKPVRTADESRRLLVNAGYQKLDGRSFMYYVRDRSMTPGGDIDRVGRQQKIMLALLDQMKSLKQIPNIPKIYNSFKDRIYTNLNMTQITALALFASDLSSDNIKTYTMPGDFLDMNGISYWGINERQRVQLVKEIFGVDVEPNMRYDVYVLRDQYNKKQQAAEESQKATEPEQSQTPSSEQSSDNSSTAPSGQQPSDSGSTVSPEQRSSDEGSVTSPEQTSPGGGSSDQPSQQNPPAEEQQSQTTQPEQSPTVQPEQQPSAAQPSE